MALSEVIDYDRIEIVSPYKLVEVRKATVIQKNGVDFAKNFEKFTLDPGTLDASNNLVDNPLSKEPEGSTDITDEIKAICNAVWTTSVKNTWKAKLIADKSS